MIAFGKLIAHGSVLGVPQSPSPASWQPMRPIAWPMASPGAMQSVIRQYGSPRRQMTHDTVMNPPINPP